MIPIAGLIQTEPYQGPSKVNRYQMYPSADLNGFTIPFLISSGQAIDKMEALARRDLPPGLSYEWTDMAYQQKQAANTRVEVPGVFEFRGDTTLLVFALSVLVAFLVLAALYESWLLPLAIVLIVPMCLLCAVAGLLVTCLDLNIFSQIGLVVLVGLATKNAILIVEFAKQKREAGMPRYEAAVEAATQRLRPILMTSFAFILGVVPLLIGDGGRGRDAQGAGHGGVQRDARRDRVRHLLHAGVLRRPGANASTRRLARPDEFSDRRGAEGLGGLIGCAQRVDPMKERP